MNSHTKRRPAEERRAITIETVIELAAEQNPNNITTSAIAERMGLTQGALFRHFPNKEAIIQAVMEWVAKHLLQQVKKAMKTTDTPLEALDSIFMAHIQFVAKHPGIPRMLFGELQRPENTASKLIVRKLLQQYGKYLHSVIEDGKARKELNARLDTEASVILFIGTIQGLIMQSLLADDIGRILIDAPRVFAIYSRGIMREQ